MEREKALKATWLNANGLGDEISQTIAQMQQEGGLVSNLDESKVFGINKNVLVVGAVLLVAGIGYYLYKNKKFSI